MKNIKSIKSPFDRLRASRARKQKGAAMIWVLIIAVIILLFSIFVGTDEQKNNRDNLSFDIDVSNLSYQLPNYTKICLPETKQQCNEDGCESIKPTVFVLYDEDDSMVYRCDDKPCEGYEMVKKESGLFIILEPVEPKAFSVKLSSDNKYVETVGLGLDTLVSYGVCE